MIISCIVAVAKDNVIGADNNVPWYLPADLQYFKKITLNHHVLMGRNCYESIGRPLPKRPNIIITRDPYFISSNCYVCNNIESGISTAYENQEEELFIIGGGNIYNQTIDLWDRLYLTEVDHEVQGDVFFPILNMDDWHLKSEEFHSKDEKNEYNYTFKIFEKIFKK